jgi:3-deoxy-D-manno-octulosonate 8-phosphate phosphatase (KDO 8-P phosphatase)
MIKLFLSDVDGTLTNGIYCMGEDGSLQKGFYSRDFHGMWMLDQAGVKVGIISCSGDRVIYRQCERAAKYALVMTGHKDKKAAIEGAFVAKGLGWDEIAYIGDDMVDLALLEVVGVAGCPSDADMLVQATVGTRDDGFLSSYAGGCGAVREFARYVLDLNGEKQNDR